MNKYDFYKVVKTVAIFLSFCFCVTFGYSFYFVQQIEKELPAIDLKSIYASESTKVYDQNNHLIVELGLEKRDVVHYPDISINMIHALVSIEDERFFEHQGIDYKRIAGALYDNMRAYRFKEGASTLTQQLVKLSYLSQEKTINRKIKEMFISVKLEQTLTKEEILEAYLNKVLFGGRIYGVEKASHYYFNKSAKQLTYEEAALLAGMVQSPNHFNPVTNPEAAKSRQILVLSAMVRNAYISKSQFDVAVEKPLSSLLSILPQTENEKYYEYIDQVIYEIQNRYHLDPFTSSLKIYTYLDPKIQDYVEKIENDETIHPNSLTQTGIVVLETKTGIVRGIGGGRNYNGSLAFNFATDAKRQPGSTIKPILDYGPSIEYLNYSPGQPYLDDKIYFNTFGSRFVPVENYDKQYKGFLTMREAIIDSRNVTAVKAFREVGSERAFTFASKLGIHPETEVTEANAIGGFQYGFSVLQMAAAYSPFGNGGTYFEPTTIKTILDEENRHLETPQVGYRAMKEETAYLMTDILHDNMLSGTAKRANVGNLTLAGKTGQTNYTEETRKAYNFPSNSVRDSWFIGYSTNYTTAVWLGYDKITEGAFLTPNEARISLDIFQKVMKEIHHKNSDSLPFHIPPTITELEIETHTNPIVLPNEFTPMMYRKRELFIAGTEPTQISNQFKPLDSPKNFIVYYDEPMKQLVLHWEKAEKDYSLNDFETMEHIHSIEFYYDSLKNRTQMEFYKKSTEDFTPSFLKENRIQELCRNRSCNLRKHSLQTYIDLLNEFQAYEIQSYLKDPSLPILSEGEISQLRGYRVWNGYRNGLYSTLGAIEYRITGKRNGVDVILYSGPYQNELRLDLTLDEFFAYDSFSIVADYQKYSARLNSSRSISINPFFTME